MSKQKINLLPLLVILHISIITISNVLVSIPIEVYGFKITWAAFSFPLVVVATDLTIRLIGKSMAQKTITFSFPFAIISSVLILYLENNPVSVALRIGVASGLAYAIGVLIDIHAFQFIRQKYSSWWIAPSLSTIVSNVIDSYTFFFTAFYNSDDSYMAQNWLEIAGTQTVLKILIGLIFFLPTYGILLNYFSKRIKPLKKS
ncbi:MAG: queuosine precursor transporter [Bacteroidota bacterium]|nr:queuosine precursor transporter [Bacteroidota bacterium]